MIVDDASGRVLEAWTGPQVRWTMARGYSGAFGRAVNAPWLWLGLTVLFVAPFVEPAPRPAPARRGPRRDRRARRVAGLLQRRADRPVGAAGLPAAAATCWAACSGSGLSAPPARRGGDAARVLGPGALAARDDRLPRSAFASSLNVAGLQRDRRRLLRRHRGRPAGRRRDAVGRRSRATTSTATPTGRSPTPPTCPSSRSCRGAAAGSSLHAAHAGAIALDLVCLALLFRIGSRLGGARPGRRAGLRLGRLPVHAVRAEHERQRRAGRRARPGGARRRDLTGGERGARRRSPAGRSSRRSRSRRCWPRTGRGGRPRRALRARASRWCSAAGRRPRAGLGRRRDVPRPHARLPGRARLAVLDLGPVGTASGCVQVAVQAAAVLLAVAVAFVPRRRDLVGLAALSRGGPDRHAARRDALVLPLRRLVPGPVRCVGAARRATAASTWLDGVGPQRLRAADDDRHEPGVVLGRLEAHRHMGGAASGWPAPCARR